MTPDLSHSHRATYAAIFSRPAPHNLQWRDVRSLMSALAEVVEHANGTIWATRNGKTFIMHKEAQKDVSTDDQLKALRTFLEQSSDAAAVPVTDGINLLVVIDHREARIYQSELRGSVPQRISPYDPDGSGRNLHSAEDDSSGPHRPERRSYYEAIAQTLRAAHKVLVFGSGKGASSAMEQLLAELALHHKDLAAKVVGSVVVDEHHLTEDQLLAKAREFYADLVLHPLPVATAPSR